MIHVDIICVGKVKEAFFRDAAAEYEKRLAAYMKLRILEVKDEKTECGMLSGFLEIEVMA